jgi:hypothetical protein
LGRNDFCGIIGGGESVMFKERRSIRLRMLLILVAACALLCGLGVQIYRELSPVRRSARQLRPGNSSMTRIGAVSSLGDATFFPPWEREQVYRLLLTAINDPDEQVRSLAALALSRHLVRPATSRSSFAVRSSAALALSRHRNQAAQVVSALVGLTKDVAPQVRETALVALERIIARGSPEAQAVIQAVVALLDDPKPAVRLEAGRALYVLGQGRRGVPA